MVGAGGKSGRACAGARANVLCSRELLALAMKAD
jgi:hypothetical protein